MCLSERDSHKQKKMTSESPRYIPTTTSSSSSSYRPDRSTTANTGARAGGTTHFNGPNTRGIIRTSTHDLLHDARRLDNPQDLYRQHRHEHLSGEQQGRPVRDASRSYGKSKAIIRPEPSDLAMFKRASAYPGVTGTTSSARGDNDYHMGASFDDDDDDEGDDYTHVPVSARGPAYGAGVGVGASASGGAPSFFAADLPIRNHAGGRSDRDRDGAGHHSYSHSGTATTTTATATNRPTTTTSFSSFLHPAHLHRERHSLRAPKERVTTYVQDNVIMRISSSSQQPGSHTPPARRSRDSSYLTTTTDEDSNGGGGGGGADHRRTWYRERMARIIQDIEPGLPPSSSSSSSSSGAGRGRGQGYSVSGSSGGAGAGGYVYSGMGMGSGSGSGAGAGGGGYGGAGSGGYGNHGTTANGHDSGYGSFSGSPAASYGRGH
ncbi:hypothetical protein QBC45DRAFT_406964 [Copromyces sp. CBS 386.78]|nr:hypothetical protein QBC45DRAFT_406964 [Copromyces sp. CBS 386.78]